MDNMAYLDKIAESNRPAKAAGSFSLPFSPKIMIGLGIAILAIIIIIIVGSALGGDKNNEKSLLDQIGVRSANLNKTLEQYNKYIKSTKLRSMGSSLSAVLNETSSRSTALLSDALGSKPDKKITEEETTYIEEVNTTLENARLNGLLDRTYVREMTYQIGILISMESECSAKTKKSDVKDFLNSSMSSLDSIHKEFSEYSDDTN